MKDERIATQTPKRRSRPASPAGKAGTIQFRLAPPAPFRLDLTVWTLRRRAENTVDRWAEATYQRVLSVDGAPMAVTVAQVAPPESPELQVSVTTPTARPGIEDSVTPILERMFGLGVDLGGFDQLAAGDARLAPLAARFRGMRPPRYPTVFEGLINAIACQQLSLTLGIMLLSRMSELYGQAAGEGSAAGRAFPRPEDLAGLDLDALRPLGFSHQKSRAIIEASRAVCEGRIDLESLADVSDEEARAQLEQLRGVGRWTAEYVLLRGLGRWHLFPGDDVGARNSLTRWLKLRKPLDYARVQRVLARWKGYGGLVYFHLLLDRLAAAQLVP